MSSRGAPDLYAITDRTLAAGGLLQVLEPALDAGLRWIQVREKDLDTCDLLELVEQVVELARPYGARVMVNHRTDVALAAGASGVHLGGESLRAGVVRRSFPDLLVGVSTHDLAAARAAAVEGADFVVFGPVFPTPSKARYGPPQGLAALERVCRGIGIPVVAVGGIGVKEIPACRAAGALGVAAIREVFAAKDPAAAVASCLEALRL